MPREASGSDAWNRGRCFLFSLLSRIACSGVFLATLASAQGLAPGALGHPDGGMDCSDPIPIRSGQTKVADTTGGVPTALFSCSANEGCTDCDAIGYGVRWFRFVATHDGAILSTIPSDDLEPGPRDSLLEVFSGSCGSLTSLACADDLRKFRVQHPGNRGWLSRLVLSNLTPGEAYYVRVAAKEPRFLGRYALSLECLPVVVPVNDECEGRLPIAVGETVIADNTFATEISTEPLFWCDLEEEPTYYDVPRGIGSLWYEFSATTPEAVVTTRLTDVSGGARMSMLQVFSSECGDVGQPTATCFPSYSGLSYLRLSDLVPGEPYIVQVASRVGTRGAFALSVLPPPPNDTRENAIDLGAPPVLETITPATLAGTPYPDSLPDDLVAENLVYGTWAADVWYRITGTGSVISARFHSGYGDGCGALTVYCGSSLDPLVPVEFDETSGEGVHVLRWCSQLGADYLLQVNGNHFCAPLQLSITDDGLPCTAPTECRPFGLCCEDGLPDAGAAEDCAPENLFRPDGLAYLSVGESFEVDASSGGWIESSTNRDSIVCEELCLETILPGQLVAHDAFDGNRLAVFATANSTGVGVPEFGTLQFPALTIPTDALELRFFLNVSVWDGAATDHLTVSLDGIPLATYTEADESPAMGWGGIYTEERFDIRAFADGAPHDLSFDSMSTRDSIFKRAWFSVDRIQIVTGECPSIDPMRWR